MIWTERFLEISIVVSLVAFLVAFALIVLRLVRGPTLPDRILSLDMLVTIAVGFIAVIAVRTEQSTYVDVAIALGLVGFLATVAFARYVINRGLNEEGEGREAAIAEDGPATTNSTGDDAS